MGAEPRKHQIADFVTLYAWRKPASELASELGAIGVRPLLVWMASVILAASAFGLFWFGSYWVGVVVAFLSSFLGAVSRDLSPITDKLARAIEIVVAPFWWWAWLHGLDAFGTPLEPVYATMLLLAIVSGYAGELILERLFSQRFGKLSIHAWERIDTQFRLVAAGRNVNLVILAISLLAQRPSMGIELVALWTLLSLIFHAVRLAQASAVKDGGGTVASWIA
jgi:hypothetical protein